MTYTAKLHDFAQFNQLVASIQPKVKARLSLGKRLLLSISEESKSREQEEKYHAMIGEIHKAMTEIGSEWSRDDWKRILIDQWAQDEGESGTKVVPSLDGKRIVQLGLQSRKFTVAQGSSFIEWLHAFGADKGIQFND